ncbi:TPA: DUF3800 domain-containing protein [Acinetobacter baumannii]|uniref:DUF3800 domain-containing protein n=1 Tax=Acinetobacter baumannii TaxID=470 RepID=UPI001C093FFD|nr:DUF3800 domain-containing protein [Acinetobacter baumannii]MDH1312460.1 DUF3800 domain-containing protein [Acinetobacter baumannii]
MLYIVYLDEFGHVGPYISPDHSQHNTHPVFGLGGIAIPYDQVRPFSTYFFKLKKNLLAFELNQSGTHPAKWEKKGSSLYTYKNIEKYKELRQTTFRLLNHINKIGGFVINVGIEKHLGVENHDSKKLYQSVLTEMIKRLDQECTARNNSNFMMILDHQEGDALRGEIVERASLAMFAGEEPRYRMIEPPVQAESHLYQTIQCADWLCGLFGRLSRYQSEPDAKPEYELIKNYFKDRLEKVSVRSSIRPRKAK